MRPVNPFKRLDKKAYETWEEWFNRLPEGREFQLNKDWKFSLERYILARLISKGYFKQMKDRGESTVYKKTKKKFIHGDDPYAVITPKFKRNGTEARKTTTRCETKTQKNLQKLPTR